MPTDNDLKRLHELHKELMVAIEAWRKDPTTEADQRVIEARDTYRRERAKLPGWEKIAGD